MSEGEVQERDAEQLVAELNALVAELEEYPDTEVREKALDLVQLILELYGEALRRILTTLDSMPLKDQVLSRLMGDEVVRAILLIHGLLPVELHARVAAALEQLRPYLISQGCDVELMGVGGGRARLRLIRKGSGAPPVAALKAEVERALDEAAPDLLGVDVEGMAEQVEATRKAAELLGRIIAPPHADEQQPARPVQIRGKQPEKKGGAGTWVAVVRALGFDEGQLKIVSYAEINVLVCKIGGEFYAYRNECAGGGRPLDDALFESPMLTCSCHGYRYDLRRGLAIERPELRLERLPLKVEDDKVKVIADYGLRIAD
jgi:nitrite reductase/ring-hydroxylating ferredoxin subunit/Fe-S cluster biogenesis protein NfuA